MTNIEYDSNFKAELKALLEKYNAVVWVDTEVSQTVIISHIVIDTQGQEVFRVREFLDHTNIY